MVKPLTPEDDKLSLFIKNKYFLVYKVYFYGFLIVKLKYC
jgi:hypothetical protein